MNIMKKNVLLIITLLSHNIAAKATSPKKQTTLADIKRYQENQLALYRQNLACSTPPSQKAPNKTTSPLYACFAAMALGKEHFVRNHQVYGLGMWLPNPGTALLGLG